MTKNKLTVLTMIIATIAVTAVTIVVAVGASRAPVNKIKGTVLSVQNNPIDMTPEKMIISSIQNVRYIVYVTSSPDLECVTIPQVKTGEKVLFNLPARDNKGSFDTCYKKGLSGYEFSVE